MTGNPGPSQPTALPLRISVKPLWPLLYNHGLRNPRTGLPLAINASLTSAMMPDNNGVEAEVPEMDP